MSLVKSLHLTLRDKDKKRLMEVLTYNHIIKISIFQLFIVGYLFI